jgi:anti-sigma regulatory factor (Ser/Thr protein kinase)
MTTAAVRTTRVSPYRNGDAMDLKIGILLRRGDEPLRTQDARQVGVMRRIAAARLRHWGLEALVDGVMLVVSELVTNAIVHGRGTVSLSMELRDGYLRVAVQNDVPARPAIRPAVQIVSDDTEHGRGLHLVEWCTVTHGGSWGVSDGGTTVWCEFPAKGEDQ